MRWKGQWDNHIVRASNVDKTAFEVFYIALKVIL